MLKKMRSAITHLESDLLYYNFVFCGIFLVIDRLVESSLISMIAFVLSWLFVGSSIFIVSQLYLRVRRSESDDYSG